MLYYDLIKNALLEKQSLTFTYHGLLRYVSPHVIGTDKGIQKLLCYQYGGSTGNGLIYADSDKIWKCLFIDEIEYLSVNRDLFQTAHSDIQPQMCIINVDAQIRQLHDDSF